MGIIEAQNIFQTIICNLFEEWYRYNQSPIGWLVTAIDSLRIADAHWQPRQFV